MDGRVLVAEHNGCYVLKLLGDVRLNVSTTIDQFVAQMFASVEFHQVIVDLTETEGMDSTTLGMLAKMALFVRRERQIKPIIVSDDDSILKLIESMGFEQIFDICRQLSCPQADHELVPDCSDEAQVRQQVLQAHQVLMTLNQKNRCAFKELVEFLGQQS